MTTAALADRRGIHWQRGWPRHLPAILAAVWGLSSHAQSAAPPDASAPSAAPSAARTPAETASAPPVCQAPWFRGGARAQLEADGQMPMSITMTVRHPGPVPGGCAAWLDIHSKSALAAMMGPPVVMDQMHRLTLVRDTGSANGRISSQHATINAQARYARLFGEASFEGTGLLSYAGHEIREGGILPGESLHSSASLQINSLHSGEAVTTIRVPRASIHISERRVGRRQQIDTPLGRRECLPIRYDKQASLGEVHIGDDVERPDPYNMTVTDWYCPSEAFVLRTEIRQGDQQQVIETTAIGMPEAGQ
ncbi:hypothetical protein [Cupriavidus gilardii]|uniref:hypothetical protein n=1 Tax=Cupriavidus gilardii TaxID=82541 RepID=UPI001EE625E4|nr:hypothetical protein [Cupriavidus gilardii]MCG5261210.1 hypothetical protein [Cupriavidus gilardii]